MDVSVERGLEEIRSILSADGGDVEFVSYDAAGATMELRLLLQDANCAECVLPRQMLETMGLQMVQAHVAGLRELHIIDPREG